MRAGFGAAGGEWPYQSGNFNQAWRKRTHDQEPSVSDLRETWHLQQSGTDPLRCFGARQKSLM
jgi:hypothetical protein